MRLKWSPARGFDDADVVEVVGRGGGGAEEGASSRGREGAARAAEERRARDGACSSGEREGARSSGLADLILTDDLLEKSVSDLMPRERKRSRGRGRTRPCR